MLIILKMFGVAKIMELGIKDQSCLHGSKLAYAMTGGSQNNVSGSFMNPSLSNIYNKEHEVFKVQTKPNIETTNNCDAVD